MTSGHQGGLHPQGGYRTADKPKEIKEPHKFTTAEKIVGLFFAAPIFVMVTTGLVAVAIKFVQICWEWIS